MNSNNNKEEKSKHKHNSLKHILHMALCCGLPIIVVSLLPLISKISPSAAGVVSRIVPFICPIMMISMMAMMMSGSKKGSCCHGGNSDDKNIKSSEVKRL